MSAPRSKFAREAKKFDRLTAGMRERMQRQSATIDRLVRANVAYADGMEAINESKSIRDARKIVKDTLADVGVILEVPNEEGEAPDGHAPMSA